MCSAKEVEFEEGQAHLDSVVNICCVCSKQRRPESS